MKSLLPLLFLLPCSIAFSQQWVETASSPEGSGVTDLAVNQTNGDLYATTGSFNWPNADSGGVHRSTDRGDTWTKVFPAYVARSIAVKSDGSVFASVWNFPVASEGLYRSTDDGTTWDLAFSAGASNNVFSIAFDSVSSSNPDVAYAGSRLGVHRSLDGGTPGTWTLRTQGLPSTPWIRDLVVAPNGVLIAAVMNTSNSSLNGVYYSIDQGESFIWATGIQAGDTVSSLAVTIDSSAASSRIAYWVLAGTERGKTYRAAVTALGVQTFLLAYTFFGNPGLVAFAFVLSAAVLFVAMYPTLGSGGGIAFSSTFGLSWILLVAGLPIALLMSAIAYHHQQTDGAQSYTLYSGSFLNQNDGAPVYRIDLTTDVAQSSSEIPGGIVLNQSYPNPFNPTTTITYQLSDYGLVLLEVYDILGRKVAELVNEKESPGAYEVTWDAAGQPTGVYFYRLTTNTFVQTKRLVLLR